MAKCFSFTSSRDQCFRYSFRNSGLKSSTTDLGDDTIIHCWVPKTLKPQKPNLVLIHGIGANAMWQWNDFISPLSSKFNLYVPDLLFFGESHTSRPERTEAFQAQCLVKTMEGYGVRRFSVVGLSYGGFVAYRMAADFPEVVEKVVLGCAAVCLEEKDMENGMFVVKSVEEAADILLPLSPQKLKELIKVSFYKPSKIAAPSCFLSDFIDVMCSVNRQQRKELIEALYKGRKLSELPKISQPTLIIWGENDQIFPPELAHRLKRHLGENAELVMLKNAGHAINMEKPKQLYNHMKKFLIDSCSLSKQGVNNNKTD